MTCETRFMYENFAEYGLTIVEPVGQDFFPFSNIFTKNRQECFIPTSNQFYFDLDLGASCVGDFFALIPPLDETFGLSETATITLQANNIYDFTTPAFSSLIPFDEKGAMSFFDGQNMGFRYWRVIIDDLFSPYPLTAIKLGHLYIGPYLSIPGRSIAPGFAYRRVDRSKRIETEGAATYFSLKNSFRAFEGMLLEFVTTQVKDSFDQFIMDVGLHRPFFFSIDSGLGISTRQTDLTLYAAFEDDPIIAHTRANYWSIDFSVREI